MKRKTFLPITFGVMTLMLTVSAVSASAENIDPYNDDSQYAYGENIGWLNFEPNLAEPNVGATVSDDKVNGFIWAENIGWINLSPSTYGGVINDGTGLLSGFAWGENVGWINFNPKVPGDTNHYGVTIDHDGNFDGWAWGENIGWIHLRSDCMVDFKLFANFALQWLEEESGLKADLYEDGRVDPHDLRVFTDYWLDCCPTGWELGPTSYKVQTSWTGTP